MMTVVGCIVQQHNLWLVVMAALICSAGSWAIVRLFLQATSSVGLSKLAWVVLCACVAGASIWCTHFVAMLGFEPGVPIGFDPVLTLASLMVAMVGSGIGFLIATTQRNAAPALGGAIVGLSIAVMHYTGMLAYRVQGIVSWDKAYLTASVVIAATLAAAALHAALRLKNETARPHIATSLLVLSIVGLHFTGMTAFRVSPMLIDGSFSDPRALIALAIAVTCVGLMIVGAGFASSLIGTEARATAADALANMSNGLTMISPTGRVSVVNARVSELFGLADGELKVGMSLEEYVDVIGRKISWDTQRIQRVLANHREWMSLDTTTCVEHHFDDGTTLNIACQPVERGGAILTYEDVTEARNGQRTIAHMAFHDALTGLSNRRMFAERMQELAARENATMMMIDLDRFKAVNDQHGHAIGDELLQQAALRLGSLLATGEQAFRLGGDEMSVLLADPKRAISLGQSIVAAFAAPFEPAGHIITIGCSVGVAVAAQGDSAEVLQQKADLALYKAKEGGRNRVETYVEGMLEQEADRRSLEQDLSVAIASGQLELWYQPLYRLPDRKLTGFEALVRWRHPARGLIPPSEFIPLAEGCGLINSIGAWVLDTACRQAALWPSDVYVSINVSAVQLRSATLPVQLERALTRYSLEASRIEIEITETAMVEHSEQISLVLAGIRALGVRIAMDDFGTGYSSLAHLRQFKIDRIKIDRSFIAASSTDPGASAIVRAVVSMARELSIDTTAEGIEEEAQLASLVQLGCGTAQGYLLSRPLESVAADARMAKSNPSRQSISQPA